MLMGILKSANNLLIIGSSTCQAGWIEKLKGEDIKQWAFDRLLSIYVVFSGDQGK